MKRSLPGINIQYPISRLILDGSKSIETRTYPIPPHFVGTPMVLVETPGKSGRFRARAAGIIEFSGCFKYASKTQFYKDVAKHRVEPESPWAWRDEKPKWGWNVKVIEVFEEPRQIKTKLGIKYTTNIEL